MGPAQSRGSGTCRWPLCVHGKYGGFATGGYVTRRAFPDGTRKNARTFTASPGIALAALVVVIVPQSMLSYYCVQTIAAELHLHDKMQNLKK
jgi:hypothetical protein